MLVGIMGTGKSTVAGLLGGMLGLGAVDTDQLVEGRAGRTVAEIFKEDGEAGFRVAEARAIAEVGEMAGPLVVSVGGGAVLAPTNRSAMRALGTVGHVRRPWLSGSERATTAHCFRPARATRGVPRRRTTSSSG